MDLTHIHLLLNHFPTIGFIIGGGLYLLSLIAKSDDLKRASLAVLLGIALIAIPTYMSGNGAEAGIKSLPGVSKSLIATHEGAALVAVGFMAEFTGAFAWLGLWQFRTPCARVPSWNLAVIALLTVVSLGLMIRASNPRRRNSPRGNPGQPGATRNGGSPQPKPTPRKVWRAQWASLLRKRRGCGQPARLCISSASAFWWAWCLWWICGFWES